MAENSSILELGAELRCPCGCLVARLVGGRLELKCRRCKRVGCVSLQSLQKGEVRVEFI